MGKGDLMPLKRYFDCLEQAVQAPAELALAGARIGTDAQYIVTMRVAGLMGLAQTPPGEAARMVIEKPYAAAQSALAAGRAMAQGQSLDRVMAAALAPIERRTRKNVARLSEAARQHGA